MKRSLLLLFFSLAAFVVVNAQDEPPCIPDTTGLPPDFLVIYPGPVTDNNPDGGFDEFACVGQEFSYTFQLFLPSQLDISPIPVDSVTFATEGAITFEKNGMPSLEDFTYVCNPPNCVFEADSLGCVVLTGTPKEGDEGIHELQFQGTIYLFPIVFSIKLPNPNPGPGEIEVPGNYPLEVKTAEDCTNSRVEILSGFSIANAPNPFSSITDIMITSEVSGQYEYRVSDLMGRLIERRQVQILEGENIITYDGSDLPTGTYLFTLTDGKAVLTEKLVVSRR